MAVIAQLSFGFLVVDLLGVFAGALSGALEAHRKDDYDVIGVSALALAAGVGGGLLRDVLLQAGTPVALTNASYLLTVLAAIAVAWFFGWLVGPRSERLIQVIDALALGGFAVSSTLRTQNAGLGVLPSLLLGVVGACGGGLSRDLLSGEVPRIFRRGELYAVAALAGSAAFMGARAAGLPRPLTDLCGALVGSGLRLLSLRFHWTAPEPHRARPSIIARTDRRSSGRAESELD